MALNLWVWGYNSHGQLGLGHTTTMITNPTLLTHPTDGTTWASIVGGGAGGANPTGHTIALDSSGQLCVWGVTSTDASGSGMILVDTVLYY
jgi:alpha-tubulin suppressor-like RCC1 family protein